MQVHQFPLPGDSRAEKRLVNLNAVTQSSPKAKLKAASKTRSSGRRDKASPELETLRSSSKAAAEPVKEVGSPARHLRSSDLAASTASQPELSTELSAEELCKKVLKNGLQADTAARLHLLTGPQAAQRLLKGKGSQAKGSWGLAAKPAAVQREESSGALHKDSHESNMATRRQMRPCPINEDNF